MLTRVNVSTLSKYASFNEENSDSLIPIDVAVEADRKAQSPVITGAMARLLGYRLEPLESPERRPVTREDGHAISMEVADVVSELHRALADNHINAAEKKRILKEVNEAIRELEKLRSNLTGA
jgi:hypothetical protein